MILAKDDIEKAVSWWAGKLMDHQPHSNGDDSFAAIQNSNDLPGILISWGGDDVARDSGAGLLLDVPPVAGGDLVYFLVKCCHGVGSFWF